MYNEDVQSYLGLDIGGSKVAAVLIDSNMTVLHRAWSEGGLWGIDQVLDAAARVVQNCRKTAELVGAHITGVGASLAGWLSPELGTAFAANLGLEDVDITAELSARLEMEVIIENDGNCGTLAEYFAGAARGSHSAAFIALGTGVGGGFIEQGRLILGSHGLAGEIGHMSLDPKGAPCPCGGRGCLDSLVGGSGLGIIANELVRSYPDSFLARNCEPGAATAKDLANGADHGDKACADALRAAGRRIGQAVRILIPLLDPDVVVVGGSVMAGTARFLLPAIQDELAENAPLSRVRTDGPRILIAQTGPYAAALGAAINALHASEGNNVADQPRREE